MCSKQLVSDLYLKTPSISTLQQTRGRKGSGFHVNLLIVAVMVLFASFLGLPWMCLAAVETSVHLDSLKVWSSFDAPGVKSHVVKIREQRLTLFFTGLLVGKYLTFTVVRRNNLT